MPLMPIPPPPGYKLKSKQETENVSVSEDTIVTERYVLQQFEHESKKGLLLFGLLVMFLYGIALGLMIGHWWWHR